MKKSLFFSVFLLTVIVMWPFANAMAQTYTVSPSGWTSVPTSNVTDRGRTLHGNLLQVKATVSGTTATFTLKKNDGSKFQNNGSIFVRNDSYAGSNVQSSKQYSGGIYNPTVDVELDFTSGSKTYAIVISSKGNETIYYYSNPITITASSSSTLSTPDNSLFSADNITKTGFRAKWRSVSDATDYELNVKKASASSYTGSNLIFNTTSTNGKVYYYVEGLDPGTAYQFQVLAKNGSARSKWSSSISTAVTTLADLQITNGTYFGTTTLIKGKSYTFKTTIKNRASVAWNGVIYFKSGNEDIGNQGLSLNAGASGNVEITYTPKTTGSQTFTLYYSTNDAGSGVEIDGGNYDNPFTVNIQEESTLEMPDNSLFSADNITATSFRAKWRSVTDATDYELNVKKASASGYTGTDLVFSTTSTGGKVYYTVTGLESETAYQFQVLAKNNTTRSKWSPSSTSSFTTLAESSDDNYTISPSGWTSKPTSDLMEGQTKWNAATTQGVYIQMKAIVSNGSIIFYGKKNSGSFMNDVTFRVYQDPVISGGTLTDRGTSVAQGKAVAGDTQVSCTLSPVFKSGSHTYIALVVSSGTETTRFCTQPIKITSSTSGDMSMAQAAQYLQQKGVIDNGEPNVDNDLLRQQLAKIAFRGVYSIKGRTVPTSVPSDNYPTVYSDLTDASTYYFQSARALLYLEYGDGITPFDRNRLEFAPSDSISRLSTLKVLMETFNIKPDLTGTDNPFSNDDNVKSLASRNPLMMGYIRKAASLGIITTDNQEFRPYDYCLRGEAFIMLTRIMQKIDAGNITDPNPGTEDYFEPLNTTLATISLGLGLPMGNFQHYTKTSFAMSGVVPLVFAHTYNSYNTTLPEVFYGAKTNTKDGLVETYQPLGDGWSHNFHSYITVVGSGSSMRVVVHWGGGSIDIYKSSGKELVPESYGVYDKLYSDGKGFAVKTKQQMEYHFSNQGGSSVNALYLSSIVDRNGNTLTINYEDGENGAKRISSVSDGNRSLTFGYRSGTNLVSSVSDPLGRSIKFGYTYNNKTDRYQLTSFTDAKGQKTNYIYGDDSKMSTSKLLTKIQLPKGNYIENEYDANRRLKNTVSGLNGVPTTQTSVKVKATYEGSVNTHSDVTVTRSTGTSTYNYVFNANNQVKKLSGSENYVVQAAYKDESHPELPTSMRNNSTNINSIEYDDRGNMTSVSVSAIDGSGTLTTSMTYDSMNNLTSVTDPKGYKTTYTYDSKGNLISVSAPEGVTSSRIINSKGLPTELTNPMGVKTEFEYNSYGNIIKTTLPALGLSSSASYDKVSRLISSTDALGRTISFDYDNNDNLTSETDPDNHTTNYGYDENDNLTEITNAKGGVTSLSYDNATDWLRSVEFAGATKHYDYNKDGTLSSFTKPDGTKLSYSYDELGRVTNDGVNTYEYDDKLRLSSISGNGKTLTFTYDGFNRIIGTECDGHSNSYSYDDNGNCTSINNTTYGYDKLNRLTSVKFSGKIISYSYRKDSRISEVNYPNGMTTTYGYDAVGRLTSKKTKLSNGTVIASYSFELDNVGNIVKQTCQEPYDDIYLESEDISYSYNNGNRITKAGDISFSFDENGNTTKRGSEQYQWDKQDRLTKAGSTTLTYDPLGLIASYGDISFTINPIGIGDVLNDSRSSADYIYGDGLEARVKNGKVSYYVTDFRGSVVAIVDDSGNVTHKYQYDDYGRVVQKEEADFNPFQYVGKYGVMYLSDHQYYMRARHYDPSIGRFLSEDPIWSTNLYPYVSNNPITFIDPEGEILKYSYNGSTGWVENGVIYYDSNNKKNNKKIKKKLEEAMKYQTDGKYFYENGKRKYWTSRYVFLGGISDEAKTILLNNYSQYGDDTYWLPEYTKNNNDIFIDNVVGKDSPYTYWGNATKSCFKNSKECLGW